MNYIYGASGHGKVIWSILMDLEMNIDGFIDQDKSIQNFINLPVIHSEKGLDVEDQVLIAIGHNRTREIISKRLPCRYLKIVHPSAYIWKEIQIGAGTVVMANSCVQVGSRVGKHCILNTSCSIDHDCLLEDFVHISPNAILSGNVTVKEGAWIGAGATVIQGVTIGKWSVVGAGAVVIEDVPDGATVVGIPAKVIKPSQHLNS